MNTQQPLELIERIANLLRANRWRAGQEFGLQPVHLQVLGYLSQCNRYSDTSVVLGKYLGITKGTLSQSITLLVNKGLLKKVGDHKDKRVIHLKLTGLGLASTAKLGFTNMYEQLEQELNTADIEMTQRYLQLLLSSMQKLDLSSSFGVCHTCKHFVVLKENKFQCGLTEELLTMEETELLCHEHG